MDDLDRDEVKIREARIEEAETLTEVAYASKRYWKYREESLDEWCGPLTVSEAYLRENPVFVAERKGKIVGFCSLLRDRGHLELDHMWVLPEAIGQKVGARLFARVREEAQKLGEKRLYIISDPNAEGFYLRMGAHRVASMATIVDGERKELPYLVLDLASSQSPS